MEGEEKRLRRESVTAKDEQISLLKAVVSINSYLLTVENLPRQLQINTRFYSTFQGIVCLVKLQRAS